MLGKILAVDDSQTMRQLIEECLKMAGFEVITAEDGKQGVAKYDNFNPDVIITDINMPVMDGYELIETLRGRQDNNRVPILVLTTESSAQKRDRAKQAGATGWIVKPFEPEKLVSAITRVMP